MRWSQIILPFLMFAICACVTSSFQEDFRRTRLGMDKDDILERLGTPYRKDHFEDKDWWYYTGFEQGIKYDKMVVFKNNQLIYAGKVATPPHLKKAARLDEENQMKNEELDAENEKARARSIPDNAPPSAISEDLPK